MDDDKDDKSILEKFTDTVKSVAGAVVDAGKSPATLSHDVAVAPDAALMPIPLVPVAPAPKKKRKAPVKLSPAKIPPAPKNAAAKAAKKSSKKSAKKTKSSAGRKAVGKKKTAKKVAKKKKAKKSKREMFQTSEPILYDLPATLHKWQSLEKKGSGESLGSMQIWEGTLAGGYSCGHRPP